MTLAINSVLQMFFCLPLLFFFKGHQHFLKILLYLELLVLSIVLFYCIYSYEKDVIFFYVFLAVRACEAGIGLGCLVIILRSEGNDFLGGFFLRKC